MSSKKWGGGGMKDTLLLGYWHFRFLGSNIDSKCPWHRGGGDSGIPQKDPGRQNHGNFNMLNDASFLRVVGGLGKLRLLSTKGLRK